MYKGYTLYNQREKDIRSIHQNPHRTGIQSRERLCEFIGKQLEPEVIKLRQAMCAGSPLLISRKERTLQFSAHYQRRNTATISNDYKLSRMDDCIDSLRGAMMFSAPAALWRFCKLPINDEDMEETMFKSHHGFYSYVRKFQNKKSIQKHIEVLKL